MASSYSLSAKGAAVDSLHATLRSFPIACFSLAVVSDTAYWRTSNLLWLHFSEWLLFAGLVFGILAIVACGVDYLARRIRPSWLAIAGGIVVLVLAAMSL